MKINIFYNDGGISLLDILTNDYISFIKKYFKKRRDVSNVYINKVWIYGII